MGRYRVPHRYASESNGVTYGPWEEGQEVELDDEQAAWLMRDSLPLERLDESVEEPAAEGEAPQPADETAQLGEDEPVEEPAPKPARGRRRS